MSRKGFQSRNTFKRKSKDGAVFPIDLNFHENSEVSSRDESCELCAELRRQGWLRAGCRTIASRNLSGYHQPPQSVKRQLQALFCARPDCRHSRNHRHGFCVYSLVRFHAPILVPPSKLCKGRRHIWRKGFKIDEMNRFSIRRFNNSSQDSRRLQFSAKDTEVCRAKSLL